MNSALACFKGVKRAIKLFEGNQLVIFLLQYEKTFTCIYMLYRSIQRSGMDIEGLFTGGMGGTHYTWGNGDVPRERVCFGNFFPN